MGDVQDRARALLAAASPAESWSAQYSRDNSGVHAAGPTHSDVTARMQADCELVGAAPSLLAALCDELAVAADRIRVLEARNPRYCGCITDYDFTGGKPSGPNPAEPDCELCNGDGAVWSEP